MKKKLNLKEARVLLALENSYTRLEALLRLQPPSRRSWLRIEGKGTHQVSRGVFFRLLGEQWPCCDNIFAHREPLDVTFRMQRPTRRELNLMMTAEELTSWEKLPDPIIAYRGCSEINRDGFSYTLDRQIAVRFATYYQRYRVGEGQTPLLLTVEIPKANTILIQGRAEEEIIATRRREVHLLTEEVITPEEAQLAIPMVVS